MTARKRSRRAAATVAAALALVAGYAGSTSFAASGGTTPHSSILIQEGLCETTGGGAFVDIPGFPGEAIDVRLLNDIAWMVQRYKIFVTDGYATSGHAPNGEHPIGLALDIIPNKAVGGTWRKVTRLARLAEPTQNNPVPPFRWVGYNGDANHGRGNHLHLSWMHSRTPPRVPAATVYTRICPDGSVPPAPPPPIPQRQEILRNLPTEGPLHDDFGPLDD